MSKVIIFLAIVLISFVVSHPLSDEDHSFEEDDEWVHLDQNVIQRSYSPYQLYRGQFHFAVSLFNTLKQRSQGMNYVVSPHSAYRALLLAYFGAQGETKVALEKVLSLDWAQDRIDVADAYKRESIAQSSRVLGKHIKFNSVDKLYVTKDAELNSNITELFAHRIEKVDFSESEKRRMEINSFVSEVTEHRIRELLKMGTISAHTNLVLVNAAFFKGIWATKFNKENTQTKTFNTGAPVDVEMMHVRGKFNYGILDEENAAFLEMQYEATDQSISMFIYLPLENSPTAVDDMLDKFTVDTIRESLRGGTIEEIDVELPKMSLESSHILGNVLETMGVKGLFGLASNLKGFAENVDLFFDDIVQVAKIDVDEEGSVAAAATASVSRSLGFIHPAEPIKFHCNHPFAFMINDRATQEVLFAGVYRGPNQN